MTSRERVRLTLDHKLPDRIPNALGACETAGLHIDAYETLKEILGVHGITRMDSFMSNAVIEEEVLRAMDADMMLIASPKLNRARLRLNDALHDWHAQSLNGKQIYMPRGDCFETGADGTVWWMQDGVRKYRRPASGIFFDEPQEDIFAEIDELIDPRDFHPQDSFSEEQLRQWEHAAKQLYESTEYALSFGESITDLQAQPGGFVSWCIRLKEEPDSAHEILDKCCDAALKMLQQLDQAVGKYVEMLSIAHDFGDSRGVLIGADNWRAIYKPHYLRLFTEWKRTTHMKSNFHSCGAIADIIGDLVECGIDVLNPVQLSARGMDAQKLKALYGDRLVFYGGSYDAIATPPGMSIEAVYENTNRNIRALAEGGGYLFAGVHNITGDIPRSHLEAVLRAYEDCKWYAHGEEATP